MYSPLQPLDPAGPLAQSEEVLVPDPRAGLTPADLVERKLRCALGGGSLLVSHTRAGVPRDRGRPTRCSR